MGYWAQKIVSTQWIVFLCASICFVSCNKKETITLPYYNTPDFNPIFLEDAAAVESQITHHIGDFSLLNQDNQIITEKNIEGKIHVANFIFTSCVSICPKMTNLMKRVDQTFQHDDDVKILSYSVTPWIDSVETLHRYADEKGINSRNWHLLTGSRSKIYELARRSYFAEEDLGFTRDSTEFLHTEHFLLVDRNKRIRGIYNGTLQLEINQLIEDIRALKEEE
jgi:protein SCO1